MTTTSRGGRSRKKQKQQQPAETHFSRRLLSLALGLAFLAFSLERWRAAEEDVVATSVIEREADY